jgi:hypothetical protein
MSRGLPIESLGIPKNSEWGPVLWEMLHGAAEKLGKTSIKSIQDDQRREMTLVLRYVEVVMPCAMCRAHYKEWRTKNPIDKFPEEIHTYKTAVREWLFNLHQEVNDSRELARVMTIGDLEDRYGSVNLKEKSAVFFGFMERAIRLRVLESEPLKRFNTHFTFLTRLLM